MTNSLVKMAKAEALAIPADGPFSFRCEDGRRLVVASDGRERCVFWVWMGDLSPALALREWKANCA